MNAAVLFCQSNTTADVSEAQQEWCQHSGACANVDGGYMCVCLDGWQGPRCQDDVDECFGHPCQHKGVCVNTQGGFTCDCPQGFTGKVGHSETIKVDGGE